MVPHSLANTLSVIPKHLTISVTLIISPQKRILVNIMLDSGATGNFLDLALAAKMGVPIISKDLPEAVRAVDGSDLSSGLITHQTQDLVMTCDNVHTEKISFDLIDTPIFGAILGVPWLQHHNTAIDWQRRNVTLNSHYCVHNCYPEPQELATPLTCGLVYDQVEPSTETQLPEIYQDFVDVFDKDKASILPPHRSFDCRIDLTPRSEGASCRERV